MPVQVCQAEASAEDIRFSMGGPNGERLEQRYCVHGTETLVPKDQIQKGLFEPDGAFIPIDKSAIENIDAKTKMADLDIQDILTFDEALKRAGRIRGMYYLQMNGKAGSANSMKLFVDALALEGKCMVTKWTPRKRQELLVIRPEAAEDGQNILVGYSYAFAADIREPDEAVRAHVSGTYTDAEMKMARQLLGVLADTDANTLDMEVDEALPMRHKLVDDARQGKVIAPPEPEAAPAATVGLADALAQALAQAGAKDKTAA